MYKDIEKHHKEQKLFRTLQKASYFFILFIYIVEEDEFNDV